MEDMAVAVPTMTKTQESVPEEPVSQLERLLPAFNRLDLMLERAVRSMDSAGGTESSVGFRGLYVGREEVGKLLQRKPAATPFEAMLAADEANGGAAYPGPRPLLWMMQEFQLGNFDADVLLLSLAPELDLRYEKIYAYLQDDVTRKRPTVELILNLLCHSAEEKLRRRAHFHPDAPLVKNALVHVRGRFWATQLPIRGCCRFANLLRRSRREMHCHTKRNWCRPWRGSPRNFPPPGSARISKGRPIPKNRQSRKD